MLYSFNKSPIGACEMYVRPDQINVKESNERLKRNMLKERHENKIFHDDEAIVATIQSNIDHG